MKKLNVLLICGTGASSGFMAANMRNAAAEKGIDMEVKARSESEIENYIDTVDCIMIAPHLAYLIDEIESYQDDYNISIIQMKDHYYATLDGQEALAHLLSIIENEGD